MTTTTYYNLNIVEGTDIVNPLTVDNPNYEKIDETMHNNAVAGVTLATEIANATVHAITRENSDCAVIRFIATSRWKAGDTATVDGVPVTALLPSGETLPDGAYVINANVLCILTGTNLTVYVEGNKVENANQIPYNETNVGAELDKLNGSVEQINGSIAQINSNLNVRYNEETDMVQIYYNGKWVDWKIANLQSKVVFDADNQPYMFVSYKPSAGSWTFTQNADNLYGNSYNANTFGIFSALVDVTDYTKMTVHFTSITIKNWGYVSIGVGDTSSSVSRTESAYRYDKADGNTSTVSNITVSLSIADLSGDKYVGIQLGSGANGSTASFYVDKIILEK